MINFSYLHQPGRHRNPKNPLTLQTQTLRTIGTEKEGTLGAML